MTILSLLGREHSLRRNHSLLRLEFDAVQRSGLCNSISPWPKGRERMRPIRRRKPAHHSANSANKGKARLALLLHSGKGSPSTGRVSPIQKQAAAAPLRSGGEVSYPRSADIVEVHPAAAFEHPCAGAEGGYHDSRHGFEREPGAQLPAIADRRSRACLGRDSPWLVRHGVPCQPERGDAGSPGLDRRL